MGMSFSDQLGSGPSAAAESLAEKISRKVAQYLVEKRLLSATRATGHPSEKPIKTIVLDEMMRTEDLVRTRRGGWRQLGVYDG